MTGRISLLIDSPLRTVMIAAQGLEPEVRRQINRYVKAEAQPIWAEATREQVTTRLQTRLADSAVVGVTNQNVFLRAGGSGVLGSGTPLVRIAKAIEFGALPDTLVPVRSRTGTEYKRRLGRRFRLPRRRGYVAHPAAADSAIRRIAALVVATTVRTTHEVLEEAARG